MYITCEGYTSSKGSPLRKFSALWDKKFFDKNFSKNFSKTNFSKKIVIPPSLAYLSKTQFFFSILKGPPYEMFRHCETEIFFRSDTPLVIFIDFVSALWDENVIFLRGTKFLTKIFDKNRDTPSLVYRIFIWNPIFLAYLRVSPSKNSALWE